MKRVEIVVPCKGIATGKVGLQIETTGFQGQECRTATAAFEAMGVEVEEEAKSELYEAETNVEHLGEGDL